MFLIYIRNLFVSKAIKIISYIDNISLIVATTSFKKNIKILEREVALIYTLSTKNTIQFDLEKTKLIYFGHSTIELELPNSLIIKPKELVKWLGIWFDKGLTFK